MILLAPRADIPEAEPNCCHRRHACKQQHHSRQTIRHQHDAERRVPTAEPIHRDFAAEQPRA
jgi:hypothetical protein